MVSPRRKRIFYRSSMGVEGTIIARKDSSLHPARDFLLSQFTSSQRGITIVRDFVGFSIQSAG